MFPLKVIVDQVCESVVCMRETKVVCIVNSCNRLLLLNMAGVDCMSSTEYTMDVVATDKVIV